MLSIDLRGKRAFIAGIADDQGFGWAIARALAMAGAELFVGTWTPLYPIFTAALKAGKFDENRRLPDGQLMQFAGVYPLDAAYDTMEDVPQDVSSHKRYKDSAPYTLSDVATYIARDAGTIDCLVHALANAPEVQKPLLDTSRSGYLAAVNTSTYSFLALLRHFGPLFNPGASALTLSYIAAERAIPGYGGGMSSAKAALESDVKALSWEAGRKWGARINAISAGPLRSRAAKAIGSQNGVSFIDQMIRYTVANAPLARELNAAEVANTAAFLLSDLSSAITGAVVPVDQGLHAMGIAPDSASLK